MEKLRYIQVDEIPVGNPVFKFNEVWEEYTQINGVVAWGSFKPMKIPAILPWVVLNEKQGPGIYFCRVCGSGCDNLFEWSAQGKYLTDTLPPEIVDVRLQELTKVEAGEGPFFSESILTLEKEIIDVYRGVFGFATDGENIDRYIAVIAPVDQRRWPITS